MRENSAQTYFREAFESNRVPNKELLMQAWDTLPRFWQFEKLREIMLDSWEVFNGKDR